MAKFLFINNWEAALQADLSVGATSMAIEADRAAQLVGMVGGDFYFLTLIGLNAAGREVAWEIVKVTANSGGMLTIERHQDGSVASLWPVGTRVAARIPRYVMEWLRDHAGAGGSPGGGLGDVADDGRIYRRRFEEWLPDPVFEIPEDAWTDSLPLSFVNATLMLSANTVCMVPYVPAHDVTVDQVGVFITTAAASSNLTIKVYESDAAGWPGGGLSNGFCTVSAAATGHAAASLLAPVALQAGRRYWLAVHPSAGFPTLRATATGAPVMGSSADGATRYTTLQRSISWATGMPDTWEFLRADLNGAAPPLFRLHRAAGA